MSLVGFLKKLVLLILIVAIDIPIRYRSTNPKYILIRLLHSTLSLKHSLISDPDRPTLSAGYRAFENLLRLNSAPKADPLEDPLPFIKTIRSTVSFADVIPKPTQCKINKEIFEYDGHTVDGFWVDHRQEISNKKSDKILIYFHGGGYILGDIDGFSGLECHLSRLFNLTILHIEYRLSPEHPLPAAVEDTTAVYHALLDKNISPSQLLTMGDSAGGGLSLLTIQAIIANKLPVPHAVVVLSPWADLSISGESYTRNVLTEVLYTIDDLKWIIKQALGSNPSQLSANNSMYSPLFGSFEGFPQMYVTVGTAEVIEDDARGVVKKAQEAGVDVTFEIGLHMMHCYPLYFPYFPEARHALDNINKWIQTIE